MQIQAGEDAGTTYQMTGVGLSIGRSPENDITLNDMKVSRKHVQIDFDAQGMKVRNLSSKAPMYVNGQECKEAHMQAGSVLKIGNTELVLVLQNSPAVSEPQAVNNVQPQVEEKQKRSPIFYILVLIVIALAYLGLSNEPKKEDPITLRDQEMIQTEIEESKKIAEQLANKRHTSGKETKQYLDAQESYLKGFRDYREGNYPRAITSFEAAIALYPHHPLANEYLVLAKRKLGEEIQFYMQEGNRFFENSQYRKAISSYKTVMVLIKDKNNPNYKAANAKLQQARAIIEGNF